MEPGDWPTRRGARRTKAGAGNQKRVGYIYLRRCLPESGHCSSLPTASNQPSEPGMGAARDQPIIEKENHFPSFDHILTDLVLEWPVLFWGDSLRQDTWVLRSTPEERQ